MFTGFKSFPKNFNSQDLYPNCKKSRYCKLDYAFKVLHLVTTTKFTKDLLQSVFAEDRCFTGLQLYVAH